jgi:hypothetical protein
MIEVRSSYLVRMEDVNRAAEMWRQSRDEIWPLLGWSGRVEQMLHGKAQQSTFVWSSEWESLAAWEEGMARTRDCGEYQEFSLAFNAVRVYGTEREVFRVLEPAQRLDTTSGAVEIRSSYLVPVKNVARAEELARRGQETIWPLFGWSGQNQQMLLGKSAQSAFVWTSVWPSLGVWEGAMAQTGGPEFQAWFTDWKACVDFGGEREIFRIL